MSVANKWLNETKEVVRDIKCDHAEHCTQRLIYSLVHFYRWTVVVKYFNLNFTIYRFTALKCGHNLMIALFDFGKLFTCLTAFFSIG